MHIFNLKRLAACVAAFLIAASLSACDEHNNVDWDSTLPTVTTPKNTEAIVVMIEQTYPTTTSEPVTTSVTTTPTSVTEPDFPTSAGSYADVDDDDDLNDVAAVTAVPSVPITDYTITTASTPVITTAPAANTSVSDTSSESSVSETTNITGETVAEWVEITTKKETKATGVNLSRPYCYRSFNDTQKYVYDMLVNAMEHYKTEMTIPASVKLTDAEYKEIYQLLYNDDSSIYYSSTLISYKSSSNGKEITINYKYTEDEVKKMQKEIDTVTDKILAKITDSMTEYDVVKLFFDEIAGNGTYDASAPNCSDIYGCLVNQRAICGGFSKAFNYLCTKAGIDSLLITGVYDEPHMWNMVKIDNEWYHVDVTAGIVKSSSDRYVRYDYFCVNDDFIKGNRTVYPQDYTYPKAEYSTYNYFTFNKLVVNSYEETETLLSQQIIKAAASKEKVIQFSCSSAEQFDIISKKLFDPKSLGALNILDSAYPKAANKYNRESVKYNLDEQTLVIKIFIAYLD